MHAVQGFALAHRMGSFRRGAWGFIGSLGLLGAWSRLLDSSWFHITSGSLVASGWEAVPSAAYLGSLAFVLPLVPRAHADTAPGFAEGDEFQVSTSFGSPSYASEPAIEALRDGFVAVWSGSNGSDATLRGRRFDINGTPQGDEFQVNDSPYIIGSRAIASHSSGFVVVWDMKPAGNSSDVYGRRFGLDGTPLGGEFSINSYTLDDQRNPSVTALNTEFVAVWRSEGQDGNEWGVYGQRFDFNGSSQGNEFLVNTYTTRQKDASVSAVDNGFVVVWESSEQDGSGDGVYGQRFDFNGSPQGEEFQVNSYTMNGQHIPYVEGIPNGFVVAWMSIGQDGSGAGVFAQRFDLNSSPQGSELQVNSFTSMYQGTPVVAALESGFIIVWEGQGPGGGTSGIYGQLFDFNGSPQGDEFQINSFVSTYQGSPTIAALSNGFVVAWVKWREDSSGQDIYAKIFTAVPQTSSVATTGSPGASVGTTSYVTWQSSSASLETTSQQISPSMTGTSDVSEMSSEQDSSIIGALAGLVACLAVSLAGAVVWRCKRNASRRPEHPHHSSHRQTESLEAYDQVPSWGRSRRRSSNPPYRRTPLPDSQEPEADCGADAKGRPYGDLTMVSPGRGVMPVTYQPSTGKGPANQHYHTPDSPIVT